MAFFVKILNNVLGAFYSTFGTALLITILGIFTYLYFKEHGVKASFDEVKSKLKADKSFIILIIFMFYTAMLLLRTIFCRTIWMAPLSDVIGTWGFYNKNNELYTENIENIILFIPFSALLFTLISLKDKIKGKLKALKCFGISLAFGAGISLAIELIQVLFKIGCFQLSDIFFNTIGSLIGGIIYYIIYKLIERKEK